MRFLIVALPVDGFAVHLTKPNGDVIIQVEGFATHEAAQDFIQTYIIKALRSIGGS